MCTESDEKFFLQDFTHPDQNEQKSIGHVTTDDSSNVFFFFCRGCLFKDILEVCDPSRPDWTNTNTSPPFYRCSARVCKLWKLSTFLISGINLWKVKEALPVYGNPSCKIDANLLKIHRWPGFNTAKCGCKWEEEKSTLSSQINLSCSLQLINTTAYQKPCFIADDGNYCI